MIHYITNSNSTGTGSFYQCSLDATDGDIIQPDPDIFPSGVICTLPYEWSYPKKSLTIRGAQTRISMQCRMAIGDSSSDYNTENHKDYVFEDVDFERVSSTYYSSDYAGCHRVYPCKSVTYNRCTFRRICSYKGVIYFASIYKSGNKLFPSNSISVVFRDCAIYENMIVKSSSSDDYQYAIYNRTLGGSVVPVTMINCSEGGNFYAIKDDTGYASLRYSTLYNNTTSTLINLNTKTSDWVKCIKWMKLSSWSNTATLTTDPHLKSTASTRTGAVTTDSVIDLDGNPRKANGAIGAYEYYVGKLNTPSEYTVRETTATSTYIDIATVSHADGYKIIVNGSLDNINEIPEVLLEGLTPSTTYQIQVIACDSSGDYLDSDPLLMVITTDNLPQLQTPTGLESSNITSTSARVGWNAVTNATDYKVEYRAQGATNWTEDSN